MLLLGMYSAGAQVTVAGGNFDLLQSEVLASSQASVTFSSLGDYAADYQHLQLRYSASVYSASSLVIQYNGVTTNSYREHRLLGEGSSVISQDQGTNNGIYLDTHNYLADSNITSVGVIDFLDFSSTTKRLIMRGLYGSASSGLNRIVLDSAYFGSTNALTSLTLSSDGTGIGAKSRFSLYGLKAK